MAKVLSTIMSSIIRARQDDGTFIPVFPITTTNEVYVDIDNDEKLSTFLNGILKSKNVDNINNLYLLTPDEVNVNDFVKVVDQGRYFVVIDTNNLHSEAGYLELITNTHIGGPNGLAQLDETGKLALSNIEPSIEFITYSVT